MHKPKTNILIRDWDGNWNELPPEGETFTFQGKHYYWLPCNCGCERPTGYSMSGKEDEVLTMHLRGTNQGLAPEDMLVKYGWAEQYFATGHIVQKMAALYIKMILDAEEEAFNKGMSLIEFLATKGIEEGEFQYAEALLSPAYAAFLTGQLEID